MRALAIFLAGLVLVFGAVALVITFARESERIFIVVDTSFPMREVWRQVPGALDELEAEGYTEFALANEKGLVHGWQEDLRFRESTPYAPCDFLEIDTHDEAADADTRVLITTPASCPTDGLSGWRIIQLTP